MFGKTKFVALLGAALLLVSSISSVAGQIPLALCCLSLGLFAMVVIVTALHLQITKSTARSREVFRSGLRENRILIRDVRNAEKLNTNRMRKDLDSLSGRLTLETDQIDRRLEALSESVDNIEAYFHGDTIASAAKNDPTGRRIAPHLVGRLLKRWLGRKSSKEARSGAEKNKFVRNVEAVDGDQHSGNLTPGLESMSGSTSGANRSGLDGSAPGAAQTFEADGRNETPMRLATGAAEIETTDPSEFAVKDSVPSGRTADGERSETSATGVEPSRPGEQSFQEAKDPDAPNILRSERRRGRKIKYNMDIARQARRVMETSAEKTLDSGFSDDTAFEALTERIRTGHLNSGSRRRVLMVTSNGAGLGHLTRMAAVDRWLNSETLIYTMSSAYHRIGKSKDSIMYFPSHGDLGMNGRKWNVLMEANFEAVVKGFRPDAIVFDGTYVYRGVINVANKTGTNLIWVQRGCWKADVDTKSKQRHDADKFCSSVIIPGDYGCSETVVVGKTLQPHYVGPISLVQREDLLSSESARNALGLPIDKKLFLVQLGAGVINDIGDLRTRVVRAIQSLGNEWSPVLVRNPLSTHSDLPEVPSIQAYPLGKYYNAFEAGVFASGYNTVQESIELGLPGLFIPNLETKTDDQVRRADGLERAGLGMKAVSLDGIEDAIHKLANQEFNSAIRSTMIANRKESGARQAAELVEKFIPAAGDETSPTNRGIRE